MSISNYRPGYYPRISAITLRPITYHRCIRWMTTLVLAMAASLAAAVTPPATWIKLTSQAPQGAGTMMLLTDGTVMVQGYWNNWMRLTPDSTGSYVDGHWTTLAPMSVPRLYFASQVMPSGKVWVSGGEYSGNGFPANWSGTGEIYDPVKNTWTHTASYPNQAECPLIDEFGGIVSQGSKVITGILTTAGFRPGWYVGSGDFPSGTTIVSVDSNSQIHVSQPANNSEETVFDLYTATTGATTAGSAVITGIPSTAGYAPNWFVYGNGIPGGAVITAVNSPHEITISQDATVTASGSALDFLIDMERSTCMGDDPSVLLSPGKILAGDILTKATYSYDIATGAWTLAADKVYDSSSEEGWAKLADGSVLTYDITQSLSTGHGYAELYHPTTNKWTSISPADGSAHGTLPVLSIDATGEIGPVLRLLDGRIFQVGANGRTALYTPSTNTWAAGPNTEGTLDGLRYLYVADDAPAAILPNGHVIFAADAGLGVNSTGNITSGSVTVTGIPVSAIDLLQAGWAVSGNGIPSNTTIASVNAAAHSIVLSAAATATASSDKLSFAGPYSYPSELFDFNPATDKIGPVAPLSPDANLHKTPSYVLRMLMLPTGQLLFADGSLQLWIYTPTGAAPTASLPKVTSVAHVTGEEYLLTGTQITGQSAGASYGDDVQMDENYPIVRLINSTTKKVYYARTTNWSSAGVGTGAVPETVDFTLSSTIPAGTYELIVSAAGLQSAPKMFTIP